MLQWLTYRDKYEEAFYDSFVQEAGDKTDEPKLPLPKIFPKQIDDGVDNYQHITPRDYYMQQYFELLNILLSEIQQQLNQTSLSILSEMEDILISASNGTLKEPSDKIMEIYSSVINFDKLVNQLLMLQDFVRVSTASQEIKKITRVSTICEVMNSSKLGKSMFTEIHKLLTIYLTVPITSATAERTFSSLRRLKNI